MMFESILIIDDSEVIREQIIKALDAHDLFARYYEAEDGLDGMKKLLAAPVDIVLCDLEMPRIDGLKFLSMMKSRSEMQDLPVIILTGIGDREQKLRGLDQGASDYIVKPFDPEELVARVRIHLKIKQLQDNLKRSNELLLELSNTDPLTGMYNRRYLMKELEKEFKRVVRKMGEMSLIILDIDYFKKVNDTYGHLQGDIVLQKVAQQVQKELRNYDIAARYGGEEFIAVLPDVSLEGALVVAERIRASVERIRFNGDLSPLSITVSLGVAALNPERCPTVDGLIKLADDALYLAKSNGRNRVEHDC